MNKKCECEIKVKLCHSICLLKNANQIYTAVEKIEGFYKIINNNKKSVKHFTKIIITIALRRYQYFFYVFGYKKHFSIPYVHDKHNGWGEKQ